MASYSFGKSVDGAFDQVVEQVSAALMAEGFGVLTDIDVAATLKKKLDRDLPPYRILGACNPPLASQAIDADPGVGALMPCNVVVREDENATVQVEFLDPNTYNVEALKPIMDEARARLQRVMESL